MVPDERTIQRHREIGNRVLSKLRRVDCPACDGSGRSPNLVQVEPCDSCGGSGKTWIRK